MCKLMTADVVVFVHLGSTLPGCWTLRVPSFYAYTSVPGLIVSFIMFAMTVYKCFPWSASVFHASRRQTVSSLFLRDGILWFLAVFVTMISQVVIVAGVRMTLGAVMINMTISSYSVICCHVLLNIKERYAGPGDGASTTRMWIEDSTLDVAQY
ncbi:hypothetical protein Moror_8664 [Moniliophthora roreri MCA 2997]|uniref:Uncharacterized protein n=1 Tax=Moniliophthora roreri (strain MCA 2997) TaxID=1381753 RepID=V2WRV6_MONRO|nr:hypothetical protein Moror_8664 [Moniliophthora roreri MCA 2997]